MAVQAQYPSNILLLNRNVQDSKNNIHGANDYSLEPQPGGGGGGFIDQSHIFLNNNGVGINPRKRSREIATTKTHTTTTTTVNSFNISLQNQNHQFIDLSQLQNHHHQQQHNSVVSTGLKLSFGEQNHQQKQQQIQQNPALLSLISDELALQFKQQSDELNYFLHTQGEQLRRTLAEKRQRHYHTLLGAAEEAVARQFREKETELENASRRNAELEARAAQLSAEAQAWQARARAQEAQAMSLQAQIQQTMVGPSNVVGGGALQQDREGSGLQCAGDAEDAESLYIDPVSERRVNSPICKSCRTRAASVVLLPCRHMCVCVQCDDVVQACPVCYSIRSASVEVYLT
ncbi:BOI-related E3 ubiquitin-protein ligase 1 [Silene latifolia]|uniref:BOI-related E3 ubiquitin-protein ligase 1 n=1 Tax=Silene latifolia TaxID=37657 RepID=UPI003D785C2D